VRRLFFLVILLFSSATYAGAWSDKSLEDMTLDEKIGQMFMVPVCTWRHDYHQSDVVNLINNFHVGCINIKSKEPLSQLRALNKYQMLSKLPMLVGMDAENGIGFRMDNVIHFPFNLTIGAIADDAILYYLGKTIGKHCRRVGVHINFAPVVDVNTNASNIIHMRSFGDDKLRVAKKSVMIMQGMEDERVITCAKHFPGHGDTSMDSHKNLPVLLHDMDRLKHTEFYPFNQIINNEVSAVMSGHILLPDISDYPSTLSKDILQKILVDELGHKGLVITDALNMKALSLIYSPEEIALLAFDAGNDILLYGDHIDDSCDNILQNIVPRAFNALKEAFENNVISIEELDRRVIKILNAKERLSLNTERIVKEDKLFKDLHDKQDYDLQHKLFTKAITEIGNTSIEVDGNIAFVNVGDSLLDVLETEITRLSDAKIYNKKDMKKSAFFKNLSQFDHVIISLQGVSRHVKNNFDVHYRSRSFINKVLSNHDNVTLIIFGSPYVAQYFKQSKHTIIAYEDNKVTQQAVADIIFGKIDAEGVLPVSLEAIEE
jgi:beta-N-acetylhexosaminidase